MKRGIMSNQQGFFSQRARHQSSLNKTQNHKPARRQSESHQPESRCLGLRIAFLVCGICINAFGIAMITSARLGTTPISSLPYVMSFRFPITLGGFTFILNSLFIVGQALLLRRDFEPYQLLQFGVTILFSAAIDASMWILHFWPPTNLFAESLELIAGCAILAYGIAVEVATAVIFVPGEGLVRAISIKTGVIFGRVKIVFDWTLTALACLLSFVFFSTLMGIGIGTVIAGFLVGFFVELVKKHSRFVAYINKLAGIENKAH